jgi:hypothetical protein
VKDEGNALVNQGGGGEEPPEPPSSPSASSTSSSASSSSHSQHSKVPHKEPQKKPLLKLDVKFDLPMFNGEANAEKLNNWIRQIEVYCRVQQIKEEDVKIQLASLRLTGTALVWWESKLQQGSKQMGNLLSSWSAFISALRKQFYPLGYVQKAMMDWQSFRQGKGQSVQNFTEEFRKKALELNISLDSFLTLF